MTVRGKRIAFGLFAFAVPTLGAFLRPLAWLNAGGRYRLSWFFGDWLGLLAIVLFALGCNWALRHAVERWLRPERWPARIGLGATRAAVLLLLPGTFAMAVLQLFPGRVPPWTTPAAYRLPFEEVAIDADGLRLVGWYIPGADESAPAVVIAHGLGGSRADGLAGALVAHRIGFASLLLDHPGHAESDGFGTTFGLREARGLKAAHDWLRARSPGRPVHAIGYSMGGSAVLHAAAEYGIFERIVVDSTFGRLERVAREARLFVFGPASPVAWALLRFWASLISGDDLSNVVPEEDAAKLNRPLLIIHGTADHTVPVSEAGQLRMHAGGMAQLFLVPGAGHLETIGHPDYSRLVGDFLLGVEAQQ